MEYENIIDMDVKAIVQDFLNGKTVLVLFDTFKQRKTWHVATIKYIFATFPESDMVENVTAFMIRHPNGQRIHFSEIEGISDMRGMTVDEIYTYASLDHYDEVQKLGHSILPQIKYPKLMRQKERDANQ